jgi:type I restriction enzyme S subunit
MLQTTLSDICEEIVDCLHETAPTQEEGIPSIRTSNIENGRLDLVGADKVSEETYRKWTQRSEPQPGDLILAREAPVGEVGMVPEGARVCLGQRTVQLRPDRDKVVPRYLLFLLLDQELQNRMESMAAGSTVAHLNLSDIRGMELPELPPLAVQRRIADILGALDDKIELNRRMNRTLEEMAQTLYRHWFVDFGPFQDRPFHNSDFGPIPEGWEVKPFLETCDIETGGTPKTSVDEYWGGDVLWASAKDVSQSSDTVLWDTERTITPAGLDNSPADVLPAGTTAIVARGATTGRNAILGRDMALNQTCYGLTGNDGYSWGWTYLTVNHLVKRLRKRAYGSAFDSVTISTFNNLDIADAPPEVTAVFNEKVMPLFQKMRANVEETRTLAETRDYLLPKLISGEIEVDATEEAVEQATDETVGTTL